ncbi:hypothetical protein V8G54_012170 [Vigna mungo]|uniref:Uncharacterized protein n=1 Tax=Vigna mungo TaxID=3915 RepID=A0AAQ3S0C1_VIGMU
MTPSVHSVVRLIWFLSEAAIDQGGQHASLRENPFKAVVLLCTGRFTVYITSGGSKLKSCPDVSVGPSHKSSKNTGRSELKESERPKYRRSEQSSPSKCQKAVKPRHPEIWKNNRAPLKPQGAKRRCSRSSSCQPYPSILIPIEETNNVNKLLRLTASQVLGHQASQVFGLPAIRPHNYSSIRPRGYSTIRPSKYSTIRLLAFSHLAPHIASIGKFSKNSWATNDDFRLLGCSPGTPGPRTVILVYRDVLQELLGHGRSFSTTGIFSRNSWATDGHSRLQLPPPYPTPSPF